VGHDQEHSINGIDHTFPGGGSTFLRDDGQFEVPTFGGALPVSFTSLETISGTYLEVGTFIWPGSDKVGTPTMLEVVGAVSNVSASADIRIYDVDNGNTIAEVLGSSALYPTIVDLGTISNVTTDEALWQIQVRRATGSGANQKAVAGSGSIVF